MAETIRQYFDNKVPVQPGEGRLGGGAVPRRTWQQAWNNLSRQLFVTMPNALDRTKVNRNRYRNAVS